ncbi:MAG: hypothetical protein ROW52_10445 [Anaerolineaceae bacterium]|jgi:hypothetical protein
MKRPNHFEKQAPRELDELERQLALSLNPVQPDPRFVQRLQVRLSTPATVVLENQTRSWAWLIVTAGLFVSALLVWLLQRPR